jgi:hypothetical protein
MLVRDVRHHTARMARRWRLLVALALGSLVGLFDSSQGGEQAGQSPGMMTLESGNRTGIVLMPGTREQQSAISPTVPPFEPRQKPTPQWGHAIAPEYLSKTQQAQRNFFFAIALSLPPLIVAGLLVFRLKHDSSPYRWVLIAILVDLALPYTIASVGSGMRMFMPADQGAFFGLGILVGIVTLPIAIVASIVSALANDRTNLLLAAVGVLLMTVAYGALMLHIVTTLEMH